MPDVKKSSALVTPECTASYPFLFQPRLSKEPKPGEKPRYSILLLIPKAANIDHLKKAVFDCAVAKWGEAKVKVLLGDRKLGLPFRTDLASKGYDPDLYQGFIQPWSYHAPGVVSRYMDPATGAPAKITDPNDIYHGCKVMASIKPFAYENSGNRGVSFDLENVQLRDPGVRLSGRPKAADPAAQFTADLEGDMPVHLGVAETGGSVSSAELASLLG